MSYSYTPDQVKEHSNKITQALFDAGIDPRMIQQFLEEQIEACWKINRFFNEDEKLSEDEYIDLDQGDYIRNEILLTNASILSDLIDIHQLESSNEEGPSYEKVFLHRGLIKKAMLDARIDFKVIKDFLKSQIELFKEINKYNREKFSNEEFNTNERKILNVFFLMKALE